LFFFFFLFFFAMLEGHRYALVLYIKGRCEAFHPFVPSSIHPRSSSWKKKKMEEEEEEEW
jgi:hypothetical protein